MTNRDNESGQALVLVALSMAVLMGFMALAIDVGLLFRSRRNLQIAADAAATAGAVSYLYYGNVTTAKAAAVAAAAANGVTITASDVHSPPGNGPYTATTAGSYFEVIPQQRVGTNFMGVITHTSTTNVAARAVAGTPTASTACIYLANPTASDVLHMGGSASITATNCGIYVNSSATSPAAVQTNGNPHVSAAYINIHGGYSFSGHSINPTTSAPAMSDPLGTITGPTPATNCTTGAGGNTSTATTINGTTGPLLPSSNHITCFSNAVTFQAGTTVPGGVIYVFENGLTIGGTMTLGSSTSGVTLDIQSGTFNQANSNLSIFAPTTGGLTGTGPYNGIAIMQPASNASQLQVQFGSGTETLDGMIYAPAATVVLQDGGGGVTATGVVADKMTLQGSTSFTIPSYSAAHPTTTPLRSVTLVE
jgi:Flp pilus assembly protein TadG